MTEVSTATWKEIATGFLKVGATAYGGPAIMGVMQAEFQETRQWVSKSRFVEGLALVNVLPGATATQLGIFLGYERRGWWGALLAGLCFALPGFLVMLALTATYAALGVSPILRGALYGLGPVVVGIFIVAWIRLGRSVLRALPHRLIAGGAAVAALASPLGAIPILLLTGGMGLFLFHSRRVGAAAARERRRPVLHDRCVHVRRRPLDDRAPRAARGGSAALADAAGVHRRARPRSADARMAKDKLQWMIFAVMAVVTAWTESEIVWLFLLSGVVALVAQAPPAWLRRPASACLAVAVTPEVLAQILWFFTKAGAFVFGSGLAIVPFLHGGVVQEYGWLNDKQFLDAVAVAMLTPGPILITVAFIGYLVASFPGAVAAAVGVFLPVYLFVIIPFPYFDRISANPKVRAFVAGVTAAASGAIAGACFVLARRAIVDVPTLAIGLAVLGVTWRFKVPEPLLIAAGAAAGLVITSLR